LINEVYDDAGSGMWRRRGTRTNPTEVERLLRARALILAEVDGVLVGSVNVNLVSDGFGEFAMLVADRNYRGVGIGSALVEHAEQWARQQACHTMRPELLTPSSTRGTAPRLSGPGSPAHAAVTVPAEPGAAAAAAANPSPTAGAVDPKHRQRSGDRCP
jgi:GNAT superfamily N-acetyltransferase